MFDCLQPHGLYSPWNSPGQNTGVDSLSFLQGILPNRPGIEPMSSELQADSLPAEPQRKPNNTGVGRLSLLQRIFPTQELNWGLLYCRRILYQLSYKGSLKGYIKLSLFLLDDMYYPRDHHGIFHFAFYVTGSGLLSLHLFFF